MAATTASVASDCSAIVEAIPSKPDLLSNDFLQKILQPVFSSDDIHVERFAWKPLEIGVISEVVAITVFVRHGEGDERVVEKHLVAKFLRPEFPFESMFRVESNFYTRFAGSPSAQSSSSSPSSSSSAKLPFAIPTPIFTSSVLIVLERVESVETYTCLHGCPSDQVAVLVRKLAQMHARFWNHSGDGLASPAGIGSALSGAAKKTQFPDLWSAYLDDIPLDVDDKSRLTALCQRLSGNPEYLESAHKLVENGPSTLIHGDYHVANMLFSTVPSDQTVWLLDWATCGKGNPMRDLAFFFIVSVTEQDRRQQESDSLALYHDIIAKESPEAAALTLDDWKRHYRICVLNQFLILVVYDHLSKHLAANAKTEKLRNELDAHFRKVNLRACLSVLDNFHEEAFITLA